MKLLGFTVLVFLTVTSGMKIDLDLLERYLETAAHESERYSREHFNKREITVANVLAFIDAQNVPELNKAVIDMDVAAAVDQAYNVVVDYSDSVGISDVACVQTITVATTLKFAFVTILQPFRIALMTEVGQAMATQIATHRQIIQGMAISHISPDDIVEEVQAEVKLVLEQMGLPNTIDIAPVFTALKEAFKTVTTTTTGKQVLAAMIAEVSSVVRAGMDAGITSCDLALVQQKLVELKTQVSGVIGVMTDVENIERIYQVDSTLAATISGIIVNVFNERVVLGPVQRILTALDGDPANLGEIMAKTMIQNVLVLVQNRANSVAELTELTARTGPTVDLNKPIEKVTITDIFKFSLAGNDVASSTFGFTCEKSKYAAVIAGIVEMHRMVFTAKNPVVKRMGRVLEKIVEEMTSESSDSAEDIVDAATTTFFDELFENVILPIAADLDSLIGNARLEARLLPMRYVAIFSIARPDTMEELIRMGIVPGIRAFTESVTCPNEPSIADITAVLNKAIADIDTKASAMMVIVAEKLGSTFKLNGDQILAIKEVLVDMAKLMASDMTSEILNVLAQLEIDGSIETLRQIVGVQVGEQIYDTLWRARLRNAIAEAIPKDAARELQCC